MPKLSRSDWYDLSRDEYDFKETLAEVAQAHGDSLTAQLLRESGVDSARSNAGRRPS